MALHRFDQMQLNLMQLDNNLHNEIHHEYQFHEQQHLQSVMKLMDAQDRREQQHHLILLPIFQNKIKILYLFFYDIND